MKMNIELAAARISREVPATEACLDDALIQVSTLIRTVVEARRDTGVAASTGQATIVRLAKAQMTLVTVSNDVLRAHKDLSKLANVHAGFDIHECPSASASTSGVGRLALVG
jgi:Cu/Zn superoxide dismutase